MLYRVQIDKRAYNLYMATRELCACIHIIASGFSPHSKELLILCWAEERQTVLLCRESIGLLPSQKKLYPDLYIVRSPWSWPWEKKTFIRSVLINRSNHQLIKKKREKRNRKTST